MAPRKTYDIHVKSFVPLISPAALKKELPQSDSATRTVIDGRRHIQDILSKKDPRFLVIAGPCSIHDHAAALEYARRLNDLRKKVEDTCVVVMRVYFEKPRTDVGWKGLISDPHLDGSHEMTVGLRKARQLLIEITEMGLPTATELLDPIVPQYFAGLVCWAAIGARTTESQTHRNMASGLSMPVGFKNNTDGDLMVAVNAMTAAASPQSFIGIDPDGHTSVVNTTGNPWTHLVLRGGNRPNYDSVSIAEACSFLARKNLKQSIMVDCSHANSKKDPHRQPIVWQDVINQRLDGNDNITGMMLESHLFEGQQKNTGDGTTLKFGVSITDACIGWETTEELILSAHEALGTFRDNPANPPVSTNGVMRYSAL
ncbi:MAG: 3-deoxy-7-phosphoheptulonate synthase [Desulfobacteraceae bacterium]|nr:3-deoxy-7-phosphoheptulonate synthase [Desulfobacteraceae bacterium]